MSMPDSKPIHAAIYVRISKDSEQMGLGVKRQEKLCRELLERRGWDLYDVYRDNDVSATRSDSRPAYERMVRDITDGLVQGIVVYAVDRLTRSPRELEDVIDWADEHKLELASVTTDINLATPDGRAMARNQGMFAKLEAEKQSLRLKAKLQQLAEDGRYVGPRPFGWDWSVNEDGTKGKDLVINEHEAGLVKEIADKVLSGATLYSIVQYLNEEVQIRTARGAKWRSQNVRKLLMRPSNAGIKVHNGIELREGDWPKIFDRDKHERLVALLTDPSRVTNRGTSVKHLLSGLVVCALCNSPMHSNASREHKVDYTLADGTVKTSVTHRPGKYRCHPPGCQKASQNREMIDHMVTEYVLGLLRREGVEIFGGDMELVENTQERIASIKAKLALNTDRWIEGKITVEQYDRANAALQPQLSQAEKELRLAIPSAEFQEFAGPGVDQAWEQADLHKRRQVIRVLQDAGFKVKIGQLGRKARYQPGAVPAFNPDTVELWWGDQRLNPPRDARATN